MFRNLCITLLFTYLSLYGVPAKSCENPLNNIEALYYLVEDGGYYYAQQPDFQRINEMLESAELKKIVGPFAYTDVELSFIVIKGENSFEMQVGGDFITFNDVTYSVNSDWVDTLQSFIIESSESKVLSSMEYIDTMLELLDKNYS